MRLTGLKFLESLDFDESQKYQFNRADVEIHPVAELVLNTVFDSYYPILKSLIIASTLTAFSFRFHERPKAIAIERTPQIAGLCIY